MATGFWLVPRSPVPPDVPPFHGTGQQSKSLLETVCFHSFCHVLFLRHAGEKLTPDELAAAKPFRAYLSIRTERGRTDAALAPYCEPAHPTGYLLQHGSIRSLDRRGMLLYGFEDGPRMWEGGTVPQAWWLRFPAAVTAPAEMKPGESEERPG
jgi:hypothetical protein